MLFACGTAEASLQSRTTDTHYWHTIQTHTIDTHYRHTLQAHTADTHYRHTLQTHTTDTHYRHTLRMCNTYCFSTVTAVAWTHLNPLTPNDDYSGRTAPLTSKRCILYIYSTNIGTEYFKHGVYSPSFSLSLQNAVCFIILTYLVPVLFTFYIQGVLKLKKIIIPAPKG